MATYRDNIDRIEIVAEGLNGHLEDVIFIGGACIQFYVDNPELNDYRPTKDIDYLIEIYTYSDYSKYEKMLRSLEFRDDSSEGAPICRKVYKNILVDVIPDDPMIIGFSNIPWFNEGRELAKSIKLPSGRIIKILPLSYFLAAKLEAWKDRGEGDYLANHDIEDIITIIDGNENLREILESPSTVKEFIKLSFIDLLNSLSFKSSIAGHIGFETSAIERARNVVLKMEDISLNI